MVESIEMVLWAWILVLSGSVAGIYFVYRMIWLERFRFPSGAGAPQNLVRIRGRIVEPRGVVYCLGEAGEELVSRPFVVEEESGARQTVVPRGAVIEGRRYSHGWGALRGLLVGDRVTIDGVRTTLDQNGLYRQAGRAPGVEAVRIVEGTWPELGWLRAPMRVVALLGLFSLSWILLAPLPAEDSRLREVFPSDGFPAEEITRPATFVLFDRSEIDPLEPREAFDEYFPSQRVLSQEEQVRRVLQALERFRPQGVLPRGGVRLHSP